MNPTAEDPRRRLAVAARAPGLSAPQLLQIEALGPDLAALENADRAVLGELGLTTAAINWLANPDEALIASDLRWLDATKTALVPAMLPDYPPLLLESPDAPAVLYVRGDAGILGEPQLAMVGSRNPTAGGRATAREFAIFFAHAGLTITSGLALGIDTACHEGAL
jgi:DNA processing protein